MSQPCEGHLNAFAHLDIDLHGEEQGFDLGFKFEERESKTRAADAAVNAWGEPLLALYVSYASLGSGLVSRGTLHYAIGRSQWRDPIAASPIDQQTLLTRAQPLLEQDLRSVRAGRFPAATKDFHYL
jgi:hypothetical protein